MFSVPGTALMNDISHHTITSGQDSPGPLRLALSLCILLPGGKLTSTGPASCFGFALVPAPERIS